jgi:molybdopterin synthase catalytic subunit
MDIIKLVPGKILIEDIVSAVSSPSCGATSMFIGTTRDNFEDKTVVRLEYEAYEPMAVAEIRKICGQIREKWNVEHIAIYHRLGLVPVTEASIVIAISSEHRKESLEAVQYAIDTMKKTVPIWKKEVYGDGENPSGEENQWKANKECFWVPNADHSAEPNLNNKGEDTPSI